MKGIKTSGIMSNMYTLSVDIQVLDCFSLLISDLIVGLLEQRQYPIAGMVKAAYPDQQRVYCTCACERRQRGVQVILSVCFGISISRGSSF